MKRKPSSVTPERVLKKIEEARFFLNKMEGSGAHGADFGFYLGAFLSALKSIEYLALANKKRRPQIREEIVQVRRTHPPLDYLLKARDAEVHSEGVETVLVIEAEGKLRRPSFIFPTARFKFRFEGRFEPRYRGRFNPLKPKLPPVSSVYQPPVYRDTWFFKGRPLQVIQTCRDSLDALIAQVKKSLGLPEEK